MSLQNTIDGPKGPIRRKRPFLPKTRTGCLTCKVRKVKCDELKPHCNRCTSTGRKCDGYAPPPPRAKSTTPSSKQSSRSPPPAPQLELFASAAEHRSFAYFEEHACHDLGGSFHQLFWAREVLQAAVHYPSTRHLVVAIGAAYEGFQSRDCIMPALNGYDEKIRFSMEQSNRSIQLMGDLFDSSHNNTETTCNMLTASILFAHLACLQGHVRQAMDHVRSGLKLLQSFEDALSSEETAYAYPVSISNLASLLTSIYGQIRCMINDEALVVWDRDPLVSVTAPPISYSSIAEAHVFVESLWHNLLAFLQYTDLHCDEITDDMSTLVAHHQSLGEALRSSRDALEDFTSGHSPDDDDQGEAGLTILRLYHTLIGIRLKINPFDPASRETAFDALQDDLEQMLGYCEILAASPSRPTFASGLGYVMPLHTVAARCRNPQIRRRALFLLQNSRRREGIWDGLLTSQIATKTMEREERTLQLEDPTADESRVREVKLEFVGERKARLRYITVADWKSSSMGEQHLIEW